MSNRVEELESRVAELQAAVDGLTEELVESRERLSRLEEEHGIHADPGPADRGARARDTPRGTNGQPAAADAPDSTGEAADADADAETDQADGDSDGDQGSGDGDIIVA